MALTVNQVGGFIAVVALAAVIVLGQPMAGSVSTDVPATPAQVLKPTVEMSGPVAGCTIAKPCPVVKPVRTYRKVLTNGKLDGRIGCRYVPKIADEFDRKQVLAAAAQYGLSPGQLSQLQVCLH